MDARDQTQQGRGDLPDAGGLFWPSLSVVRQYDHVDDDPIINNRIRDVHIGTMVVLLDASPQSGRTVFCAAPTPQATKTATVP